MYVCIIHYTIYQVPSNFGYSHGSQPNHHLLPLPTFPNFSQPFATVAKKIRQDTQASATHATPIKNTQLQFPCIVSPEIGLSGSVQSTVAGPLETLSVKLSRENPYRIQWLDAQILGKTHVKISY